MSVIVLINLVRIVADLAVSSGNDLFHSNFYDTWIILTYQMLFIVLTFALFLMVNRRLVADLARHVNGREQMNQVLRASEARQYDLAAQARRLLGAECTGEDLRFCEMVGYARVELLNMSVVDLGIKNPPAVIAQLIDNIRQNGSARFELQFRHKDGQVL